jgi:hypothetical protein
MAAKDPKLLSLDSMNHFEENQTSAVNKGYAHGTRSTMKVSRESALSAMPGSYLTGIPAKRDYTASPMARLSAFGESLACWASE